MKKKTLIVNKALIVKQAKKISFKKKHWENVVHEKFNVSRKKTYTCINCLFWNNWTEGIFNKLISMKIWPINKICQPMKVQNEKANVTFGVEISADFNGLKKDTLKGKG